MAVRIILKNSVVEDKRPTGGGISLERGEITLNTHEAGPFLCCEDSAGSIEMRVDW